MPPFVLVVCVWMIFHEHCFIFSVLQKKGKAVSIVCLIFTKRIYNGKQVWLLTIRHSVFFSIVHHSIANVLYCADNVKYITTCMRFGQICTYTAHKNTIFILYSPSCVCASLFQCHRCDNGFSSSDWDVGDWIWWLTIGCLKRLQMDLLCWIKATASLLLLQLVQMKNGCSPAASLKHWIAMAHCHCGVSALHTRQNTGIVCKERFRCRAVEKWKQLQWWPVYYTVQEVWHSSCTETSAALYFTFVHIIMAQTTSLQYLRKKLHTILFSGVWHQGSMSGQRHTSVQNT